MSRSMHKPTNRPRHPALAVALTVAGLLTTAAMPALGDEPGLFGRLFRRGANPPTASSAAEARKAGASSRARPNPPAGSPTRGAANPGLLPGAGNPSPPAGAVPPSFHDVGAPALHSAGPATGRPADPFLSSSTGPSTPASVAAGNVPTIRPQPRDSRAATSAEPLLSRVVLGRTDDGNRFGIFLQVYADGTVIDGEGIHKASPEAMRALVQALQDPELARVEGHCGGPPTDFVEQVYAVIYRRKLGGLIATNFSYSGNTAGCSQAVRNLHEATELFVTRLTSPGAAGAGAAPVAAEPAAIPLTAGPAEVSDLSTGDLNLPPSPPPAADPSLLPPMVPLDTQAPTTHGNGSDAPPNTLILTPEP